jgi:gas vesicle protein
MRMKTNGSNVWPYVIVGSAIGGAVAYLFVTDSGKKIRYTVTHPDELANNLEHAGDFLEEKARFVTGHVHGIIDKAKRSIEEGERAYREAGQRYQSQVRQIESKNNEITSTIHSTIDRVSRSAVTVEQSVLDPISDLRALYRGIERGLKLLFQRSQEGPIPIQTRDQRLMGS